jgi:hypothetical protein
VDYGFLTYLFPAAVLAGLFLFYRYYYYAVRPRLGTTEWITRAVTKPVFRFEFKMHTLDGKDVLAAAIITVVFAALALFALGDFSAPQSFLYFPRDGAEAELTLADEYEIASVMYYTGLQTGGYLLDFSTDGETWQRQEPAEGHDYAMAQSHANLFKWLYADIDENGVTAKYIRITSRSAAMELGEVAFFDANGKRLVIVNGARELRDEQQVVPPEPSYMNSMYFDEIYHGRTAYETVRQLTPYENSHPPLGKLIISLGIQLFGMTPFGWRFMGAVFGALMLAVFYVLVTNMFGKRNVSICATLLLGFDFMRFVQTRIATIDTFAAFFILLSYLFMYRFISQPHDTKVREYIRPLTMSGLFFGIGCASKWVVVYAGFGLAALYFIHLIATYRYHYLDGEPYVYTKRMFKVIPLSFLFFVLVPVGVYCLSYIPYGMARDMTLRGGMLWNPAYYKMIWDNQVFMYSYHSNLNVTHDYASRWYQWITDARPILFYRAERPNGFISSFSSFGNPVIWWGGFIAMGAMGVRLAKFKDSRSAVILISYLSQILPWLFISRIVFIYHYFPSVIFLVLALAHVLDSVEERDYKRWKRVMYGFTASAAALFLLFYPALTGIAAPKWYFRFILRWLPSWPMF